MVILFIYSFSVLCLISVFLSYKTKDTMGIIPPRIWMFLTFLSFIPILNTIMLLTIIFNNDNPQIEDPSEALKELEELDKKLEELFNKFKIK